MRINYNKLWKMLIDREMTKTELREKAGITTNAIAKLGKNEDVRLSTIIKICDVLQCQLQDIFEYKIGDE